MFQKSFRCKDDRFARGKLFVNGKAGVRYIVPVDRTLCAAKVIHVAMTIHHSFDIQRAEPVFHQRFCRLHIFLAHQDIKDDPAVVGADKSRVGHVKTAHLIDAVADLKQSGFCVELGVPPQAWIDRIRRIAIQIAIALQIPRRCSVIVVNDPAFLIVQQAALCVGKLPPVGKIQFAVPLRVFFCGTARCFFRFARLGGVFENVSDKIQAVFCGIFRSMGRQRCAARQHCSSRS